MLQKIADLFRGVKEVEQARSTARAKTYSQLVQQLTDGEVPEIEAVADLLEESGRSSDQLAADVNLTLQRREWKRQLDQEPELNRKHGALQAQFRSTEQEFQRELDRVQKQFRDELTAIQADIAQVQAGQSAAQSARNKLLETSGRAEEIIQLTTARARVVRPLEQNGDLFKRQRDASLRALLARRKVAALSDGQDSDGLAGFTSRRTATLAEAEAELRLAEEALSKIETAIKEQRDTAAKFAAKAQQVEAEALAV